MSLKHVAKQDLGPHWYIELMPLTLQQTFDIQSI
jgi:hypothetical protein